MKFGKISSFMSICSVTGLDDSVQLMSGDIV